MYIDPSFNVIEVTNVGCDTKCLDYWHMKEIFATP